MNLATSTDFKRIKLGDKSITVEGEVLKKCQRIILSIAEDFIILCEKEGIWYELGGGTALGAIRHNGFIPWDDDIDINIMRKDLEQIKQKLEEYYPQKYLFLDCNVKEYGLPMCRVMLTEGIYRDRESYGSDNCGFFIDLFIIENVPNNVLLRKIHGSLCMISGGLLSCRKFYRNRVLMNNIAKMNPEVEKTIKMKISIGKIISFLSLEKCARITDRIYGICKNNQSRLVTIPSGRKHYFKGLTDRNLLTKTSPILFEGHKWQVATNYDAYLKRLYGDDYMIIPEESDREHHILFELSFPEITI